MLLEDFNVVVRGKEYKDIVWYVDLFDCIAAPWHGSLSHSEVIGLMI